jgi:5-methylcytosine-specific restriction protein A
MQGMGLLSKAWVSLMSKGWANGSTKGWRVIRERILRRDGYTCQKCGDSESQLHIDHIVPKRLGGSDLEENLQTLCQMCNLQKGGFFEGRRTPPTLHDVYIPQNVSISHD